MKKEDSLQSHQSINIQLRALLDKANNLVKEIHEINSNAVAELNEINLKVDESIVRVEKIFSELDEIEKKANNEMDKLILEQAEVSAEE